MLVFRKKRTFLSLLYLFLKRQDFDLSLLLRNTLKVKMHKKPVSKTAQQ